MQPKPSTIALTQGKYSTTQVFKITAIVMLFQGCGLLSPPHLLTTESPKLANSWHVKKWFFSTSSSNFPISSRSQSHLKLRIYITVKWPALVKHLVLVFCCTFWYIFHYAFLIRTVKQPQLPFLNSYYFKLAVVSGSKRDKVKRLYSIS